MMRTNNVGQRPGLNPLIAGALAKAVACGYDWLYCTPITPVVDPPMLKAVIVVLLVATLISLFSGLFFLVNDEGRTSRVVMALFVRVVLSALIVVLIAWGFYSDQLRMTFG